MFERGIADGSPETNEARGWPQHWATDWATVGGFPPQTLSRNPWVHPRNYMAGTTVVPPSSRFKWPELWSGGEIILASRLEELPSRSTTVLSDTLPQRL